MIRLLKIESVLLVVAIAMMGCATVATQQAARQPVPCQAVAAARTDRAVVAQYLERRIRELGAEIQRTRSEFERVVSSAAEGPQNADAIKLGVARWRLLEQQDHMREELAALK
jgi:hypothetical protein